MKKPNILGIIEIPSKEKVVTLVRYECPGQVFWESMSNEVWSEMTLYIYIYTDMNVYQYLIMLLCDSQLHLTRSSPFETIEYCAPTSLRRLVPFPPFPTLGEQAHWHHPKASLSSPKWARVEALIKQAMRLVTEYIKSKKDINVCWGRTSLCHLRQVILSSDNTDNSGARSFK